MLADWSQEGELNMLADWLIEQVLAEDPPQSVSTGFGGAKKPSYPPEKYDRQAAVDIFRKKPDPSIRWHVIGHVETPHGLQIRSAHFATEDEAKAHARKVHKVGSTMIYPKHHDPEGRTEPHRHYQAAPHSHQPWFSGRDDPSIHQWESTDSE